ncbi:type IV pilus assembly protein PilY1 [Variovorax sp. TBS-050B]|nr:type IV pilus assembly protein PilY1 [Variovorax sp. TBS-050B]
MRALKAAIADNFTEAKIPDGRIRLAWQEMNAIPNKNTCVGFADGSSPPPFGATECKINGIANANRMRTLDAAHRTNFLAWAADLGWGGRTPSHAMMTRAGEYMKTTGPLSPYSDDPGVEGATRSSCRRSFHIFMTDGEYTMFGFQRNPKQLGMPPIGNADGTGRDLPDGTTYEPRAPYMDGVGAVNRVTSWKESPTGVWTPTAEYRPTLADMAFEYWATDLQPDLPDRLQPVFKEPQETVVGAKKISRYWNPKNDPATWQHLNTYVIGFGSASSWNGAPRISATAAQPTYSGDYAGLVDGSIAWPDPLSGTLPGATGSNGFQGWKSETGSGGYHHENPLTFEALRMDLWHAALNSRGSFTPAVNEAALDNAFKSILAQIISNTSAPLSSLAASASKVSADTATYQAGYDTANWSGTLNAVRFGSDGKLADTPLWSAGALLDARMAQPGAYDIDRQVLSFSGTVVGTADAGTVIGSGVPFRWDSLSDAQRAALAGSADAKAEGTARGQAVLAFLRGDRSNEGAAGQKLRRRDHLLGDIVGSSVWYAGQPRSGFTRDGYAAFAKIARPPMVYVGANDGMLHAFNAGTDVAADGGKEVFAYVPEGLYGTAAKSPLRALSESGYKHRYYVDGSPFVADVYLQPGAPATDKSGEWKSLLVGTLGAGGKGYFVLDVTWPQDIRESGAAAVALIDTTALADEDLGHQFQQPAVDSFSRRALQVALLNNGRTAVILGNGYNSASERAVLWIQYLDGDRSILKIPAPPGQDLDTGNGLSAPVPVDRNGDGKIDLVYAGDLLGNLWKFDLSAAESSKWKATMGSSATPSKLDGVPLFRSGATQPITAAPVVVGHPRGGYMVVFGTGRLFAEGDEGTTHAQYLYGIWDPANAGTATAAWTELVQQTIADKTVAQGDTEFRTASNNGVSYGGSSGKRGWYVQLPSSKERIVYPGDVLGNSVGLFSTTIPGASSNSIDCTPGTADDGWTMVVDFFSGAAPDGIVYGDFAAAGTYLGFRNRSGRDDIVFRPSGDAKNVDVICNAAGDCLTAKRPDVVRRFGWRDLFLPH